MPAARTSYPSTAAPRQLASSVSGRRKLGCKAGGLSFCRRSLLSEAIPGALRSVRPWHLLFDQPQRGERGVGARSVANTHASVNWAEFGSKRRNYSSCKAWDSAAAKAYADLCSASWKRGRSVVAMDMLVAADAFASGLTLLTSDRCFRLPPSLSSPR